MASANQATLSIHVKSHVSKDPNLASTSSEEEESMCSIILLFHPQIIAIRVTVGGEWVS